MSLTTDPNHPGLGHGPADEAPVPQNKVYLVLSEEERAKGFTRPYRDTYKHLGLRPMHALRDLTDDEKTRYVHPDDGDETFDKFEPYPEGSASVGRFWTRKDLRPGCGTTTTMGRALSETYARDPSFYGATYCVRCAKHRPVAEFVWIEANGSEGPAVGS